MILIVPVTGNHTLLNTLLFSTLYYLASYLQKTITGDWRSLTSTDGAGGLEKDTVNLVASFETALVVMPENKEGKAKEIHLLHISSTNNIPSTKLRNICFFLLMSTLRHLIVSVIAASK